MASGPADPPISIIGDVGELLVEQEGNKRLRTEEVSDAALEQAGLATSVAAQRVKRVAARLVAAMHKNHVEAMQVSCSMTRW